MQELVERAQIQLVLNDRLIWENGYSEGRFHSIEERKQQQCLEASWIVSHGLDTVMSRRDMQLLNQEIETVFDFAKVEDVLQEGALWCNSIGSCAAGKDAVITIVGFPKDVEEVYFAEGNILDSAAAAKSLISPHGRRAVPVPKTGRKSRKAMRNAHSGP